MTGLGPGSGRGRVVGAHHTARAAFRLTGLFVVWAVGWMLVRAWSGGGSWWGPLHVFLVGGVLLAISGATQLFSITWAAAVPPVAALAAAQRWSVATGAVLTVAGVTQDWRWATVAGASLVGIGLVLLGVILVGIVRRSLLRRFGLSVRFYVLAASCGVAGVAVGAFLGTGGGAGLGYLDARTAHMHLNLAGLVGFTIYGTLPTLLPTTARHPMVSGAEAVAGFWLCAVAAAGMGAGLVAGPRVVGAAVGLAAIGGALVLGGIVYRLGARRIVESSLPGLMIISGTVWLITWGARQAVVLLGGSHTVFGTGIVAGAGGVAIVLFGSLGYLLPVLVRPGPSLGEAFAMVNRHPATRTISANVVVAAAVVGAPAWITIAAAAMWLTDYASRVIRMWVRWSGR